MKKLTLILGPCVVEDETTIREIAKRLDDITQRLGVDYIFKASYKKANRTQLGSFQTMGTDEALSILKGIKDNNHKVITDVHESFEPELVSKSVDYLQIPAFLSRQTDLILAAAKHTDKVLNVKKGQWMNAESTKYIVEKAKSVMGKDEEVWITERGNSFGYSSNIVDFTGIPIMKKYADKVIVDCTHSVQTPNSGEITGGNPEMIETIALAATAAGADGLFFEVHTDPSKSLSDKGSILDINKLEGILEKCIKIKNIL